MIRPVYLRPEAEEEILERLKRLDQVPKLPRPPDRRCPARLIEGPPLPGIGAPTAYLEFPHHTGGLHAVSKETPRPDHFVGFKSRPRIPLGADTRSWNLPGRSLGTPRVGSCATSIRALC